MQYNYNNKYIGSNACFCFEFWEKNKHFFKNTLILHI